MTGPALDELIALSRQAGARPDWVQAAGGNSSVKEGGRIFVKASGVRLADMSAEKGWIALDLGAARKVLDDPRYDAAPDAVQQDLAGKDLLGAVLPGSPAGRPSLESEFHLLGKRVCLHLHVVEVLAGLALRDGRRWFEGTLHNSGLAWAWVDYRPPGHSLAKQVQQALAAKPDADLVLMKNHGAIAYAESAEKALDLIGRLQDACSRALGEAPDTPEGTWQPLCPDDVIYPHAMDLRAANARASALARRVGVLEPLTPQQCEALKAMEGEKYRQGLR